MFSVVAMKSRTFSCFSYSANEQVCRSWEGAQPERDPSWPMQIFHTIDIMLSLGMGAGQGQESLSARLVPMSLNLLLSRSLNFFGHLTKFMISRFRNRCSETDCELVIRW